MANQWWSPVGTKVTPQNQPIPNSGQVANNGGGFAWAIDKWKQLQRFLILGSEGGTYYVQEQQLTKDNAKAAMECIAENGQHVVEMVKHVSVEGLAPRNDPALLVLALASYYGDEPTRKLAFAALNDVARIGTHLFQFVSMRDSFGGWGPLMREAVGQWYLSKNPKDMAFQCTKYANREKWTHKDVIRMAHVKFPDTHQPVVRYIMEKEGWQQTTPETDAMVQFAIHYLEAVEACKTATGKDLLKLVRDFHLPMEVIPTEKRNKDVYELMLQNYGITALIRNLGNLAKSGVLVNGSWDAINTVVERLSNQEQLVKGRVHPLNLLVAMKTYQQGHGMRGHGSWETVSKVVDALDAAFYLAFKAVAPTGKRIVVGLDVSGSMAGASIANMPLTAREASSALALVMQKVEPNVSMLAFSTGQGGTMFGVLGSSFSRMIMGAQRATTRKHQQEDVPGIIPLDISAKQRLTDVMEYTASLPFSGTDCSLPMQWALKKQVKADVFVIYTDSETNSGIMHPSQALQEYRNKMGIPDAKLIVVAMTSNGFSIADPRDPNMMDVVGFSTDVPQVMSNFMNGEL